MEARLEEVRVVAVGQMDLLGLVRAVAVERTDLLGLAETLPEMGVGEVCRRWVGCHLIHVVRWLLEQAY